MSDADNNRRANKMKKVLASHNEVAHYWANQIQGEGRSGNMFFEGESIYSYGRHYLMGKLIPEKNVALINSDGYSSSTGKHTSITLRAIPSHYRIIKVPGASLNQGTVGHFEREISEKLTLAVRARTNRDWLLREASLLLNEVVFISQTFGYELTPQIIEWQKIGLVSEEVLSKLAAKDKERRAKVLLQKKEDIEKWLNCESYSIPSNVDKIFLRVKCNDRDTVETSLHADVPVNHAKLLFDALKTGRNVAGFSIGHYYAKKFTGKVLEIGCHKLEIDEINRFAGVMGWGQIAG